MKTLLLSAAAVGHVHVAVRLQRFSFSLTFPGRRQEDAALQAVTKALRRPPQSWLVVWGHSAPFHHTTGGEPSTLHVCNQRARTHRPHIRYVVLMVILQNPPGSTQFSESRSSQSPALPAALCTGTSNRTKALMPLFLTTLPFHARAHKGDEPQAVLCLHSVLSAGALHKQNTLGVCVSGVHHPFTASHKL